VNFLSTFFEVASFVHQDHDHRTTRGATRPAEARDQKNYFFLVVFFAVFFAVVFLAAAFFIAIVTITSFHFLQI
jgi:hypothetical protein